MTIEEKRRKIEQYCFKHNWCEECVLNGFTRKNGTGCYGSDENDEIIENNYEYLLAVTDRINTDQIKNLLHLQTQIDDAIREFANTILRSKQVSNKEIKDRISYIINEEIRER